MTARINENMTLAEIVKEYPQTIGILNELHMDYCCNGFHTLRQGADEKDVEMTSLLKRLNTAADKPIAKADTAEDIEAFRELSIDEMIESVQNTHHITERQMMADVETMAE